VNRKRKSNKTNQLRRSKRVIINSHKQRTIRNRMTKTRTERVKTRGSQEKENKVIKDKTIEEVRKKEEEDNVRRESLMTHRLKLI